ncbi:hypothetical protein GCM10027020_24130 [Nocardioides salsibiostraticola]
MLVAPASSVAVAADRGPVPGESGAVLNIVLLGDSYSAGNGATNRAGQPETYGPENCYRSRVNWAEKYAAALRTNKRFVTLENHACSGGKAADIVKPRAMDTASDSAPTPEGVTTIEQADAYLAQEDLCNTQTFPDEEFWTYAATSVDESIEYDCTRKLRPQVDFITPETDLVLFTMGGNDIGFSNIVTQCFILKSGSGCQGTIETARELLPGVKQLLLDDVAAIRAAGLRENAKIVQLGYPLLQTDNDYTALGVPPYAAGDAVRSLGEEGNAQLAGVATEANVGHPGQMTFVEGLPEAFARHEPDATTPVGNVDRWINQVGDGTNTSLWYHPNGLGQTAYAIVLFGGGDYGATPPWTPKVRTHLSAKPVKRKVGRHETVKILTRVRRSDGSRPPGEVVVRVRGRDIRVKARVSPSGRNIFRLRGLQPGRYQAKAIYKGERHRQLALTTFVVRRK